MLSHASPVQGSSTSPILGGPSDVWGSAESVGHRGSCSRPCRQLLLPHRKPPIGSCIIPRMVGDA